MRRKRKTTLSAARVGAAASAAGLAATGLWGWLRRRRAAAQAPPPPAPRPAAPGEAPPDSAAAEAVRQEWSCECGQVFVVSGDDRHRVYWLVDAPISDPLMDRTCPSCERDLPGTRATAADS